VQIPPGKQLAMPSPIIFMKARKNHIEIDGMRRAHIRDAVALCDFLAHFEERVSFLHRFTASYFYKTLPFNFTPQMPIINFGFQG
jgi:Xaa-Pro aminopeptidase